MAAPTQKDWATGDLISSADMNRYLRDSLIETAPYRGATIGDMFYYSSDKTISVVSPPPAEGRYVLEHSGGLRAPEWREFTGLTMFPLTVDKAVAFRTVETINIDLLDYTFLMVGIENVYSGTGGTSNNQFYGREVSAIYPTFNLEHVWNGSLSQVVALGGTYIGVNNYYVWRPTFLNSNGAMMVSLLVWNGGNGNNLHWAVVRQAGSNFRFLDSRYSIWGLR